MISNAHKVLLRDESKREEVMNYAMVVFLKIPSLDINLNNFKMIVHLHFISLCNGFGIADN